MIEKIKLSDKYSIWKGEYIQTYDVNTFLEYVSLNKKFATPTNSNSVWIEINTPCFTDINNQVKSYIENIEGRKFINYAEHYWVYTQTVGFNMEWMHQHLLVHPDNRSTILTDYTFTFYLQTPTDVTGDQGHIVFEDENKTKHKFHPEVNDIFIFPSDIRHTAIPTPTSKIDRIVYAGSLCIDIENQNYGAKSTI